jgi:hypothetical protein
MTNLHDLIDAMKAGKVWDPSFRHNTKRLFPEQHSFALNLAQEAVCFDMGDCNNIPKLSVIKELILLPYPTTWFEGATVDGRIGFLATEGASECENSLFSVAVFNKKPGVEWYFIGVFDAVMKDDGDIHCQTIAVFSNNEKWNSGALEYAAFSVNGMLRFLMALNCINTKKEETQAPKFMNQKRAAKGKHPIFSFWTLYLPGVVAKDAQKLGGTHSSPRLHLRRGHIRQYMPGKYTWVESCVVGNKQAGIVSKDYAFTG